MNTSRFNATQIYLINEGMTAFARNIVFTVFMLYQVVVVGLSPFQLVMLGTVLEVSILLFEVPTGIVADLKSRRLSVILGTFVMGFGFAMQGFTTSFWVLLAAQILWGVGYTFTSGAQDAWIADELKEDDLSPLYMRGSQLMNIGGLLGIAVGVGLALVDLAIPLVVGGVLHVLLAVFLLMYMPEHGFKPAPREDRQTYHAMVDTMREALRLTKRRPILWSILGVTLFVGMFSEGFDRLWTKHVLDYFSLPLIGGLDDVVWFGIIAAVAKVLALGATELFRRRVNTSTSHRLVMPMLVINSVLFISLLGFAQARMFGVALLAYWTVTVMRTLHYPLWMAWINQNVSSEVRATMISAAGQTDAIGQFAGGPSVGYIGNLTSTRVAISVSSLLLMPALFILGRVVRRQEATPAEGEAILVADASVV